MPAINDTIGPSVRWIFINTSRLDCGAPTALGQCQLRDTARGREPAGLTSANSGAILKRTGQAADFGATPRPVWKQIGSSALVSDSMVKVKVKMMVARGGIASQSTTCCPSGGNLTPDYPNYPRRESVTPHRLAAKRSERLP